MHVLLAGLLVAGSVVWAALRVGAALAARSGAAPADDQAPALLRLFATATAACEADPRAVLTWVPVAAGARALWPDACARIDAALGRPYPFGRPQLEAAHARLTAEWLAWEQAHDAEFKARVAVAEVAGAGPADRARLDLIEREKLQRYQQRYEEYVRTSKALQGLLAQSATLAVSDSRARSSADRAPAS